MSEPVSRAMQQLKLLKESPKAVHQAFLRGGLAKLDVRSMLHIVGYRTLERWDYIHRMEKALRHYAEGPDGKMAQDVLNGLPPEQDK